jgi:hypothetical protein
MKKTDLIIGFLIGIATAFLGTYLFLKIFTKYDLLQDLQTIRAEGIFGKVITLGAILNIIVFFVLLQLKKEMMARGIVLATIILTLFTLIV